LAFLSAITFFALLLAQAGSSGAECAGSFGDNGATARCADADHAW
jgi:hypothetical protein